MRILGIDPGIGRCGYAIAEQQATTYICHTVGCFTTPTSRSASERLQSLQGQLEELLTHTPIEGAVIERLFFSKNTKTAFAVAEARGVLLVTLASHNIPTIELSPQHVKIGVTGYGNATKHQIQKMVQTLFHLPTPPTPDDAADALALAFTGLSSFSSPR